jgi:hypothetical protein
LYLWVSPFSVIHLHNSRLMKAPFGFLRRKYIGASLLLLFYFVVSQTVTVQGQSYKIRGLIQDDANGLPLAGVSISEFKSGTGTTTGPNGQFAMECKELPIQLLIRHLGYFSDTIHIRKNEDYKRYYEGKNQIIRLRVNPFMIDEVVVTPPQTPVKILAKEPYAVIDYLMEGNRFFALGYRNHNPLRPEIFIGTPSGRLLYTLPLHRARELYQDCLGEKYAVTNDSAYLLKNLGDTLLLNSVCDVEFFESRVRPIVALGDKAFITFEISSGGQYQDYSWCEFENPVKEELYRVGDFGKEQGLKGTNTQLRQLRLSKVNRGWIEGGELRIINGNMARLWNQINTDYRPVRSRMIQVEDSVMLFDLTKGRVFCITLGRELKWESILQSNLSKDFTGRVHRDPITNRFFLEFLNIQSSYLIEINPLTGQEIRIIAIRPYKHIDHVSVYDNKVWFLYQPDIGEEGKKLYYMGL